MPYSIFFSWQASRSTREGRNVIEQALKMAIDALADDTTLEEALRDELDLDKDTRNVPGNPPIFSTILGKIDKAAIFVPDLTSVAKRDDGQLIPNPNVLIEYGWALKSLGHYRTVTVMNVAYGDPKTEPLPFDMAHLRFPITYNLPEGASDGDRRGVRAKLAQELEDALRTVFNSEEFRSQLPRTPALPEFPRQAPLDGRARFRQKGKSIGLLRDQVAALTGAVVDKRVNCVTRSMPNSSKQQFRRFKCSTSPIAIPLPRSSKLGEHGKPHRLFARNCVLMLRGRFDNFILQCRQLPAFRLSLDQNR